MKTLKRLILLLVTVVALPVAAEGTGYPGGTWKPGEEIYSVGEKRLNYVVMDDGVQVRADVFYPTDPVTGLPAKGPFPVLLTQTPYSANLGVTNNLTPSGEYFVKRGYIYVIADQRGTGLSGGGEWDMFGYRQGKDGAALARWSAELASKGIANSNGIVGLHGCSAMGISQLATAIQLGKQKKENGTEHPVKAMIPGCLSTAQYRDTWFDNGIPGFIVAASNGDAALSLYRWPTLLANGEQPTAVGADISSGGDLAYERDFWKERNLTDGATDIVASGIPGLLYVAWSEGGRTSTFEMYAQLQNAWAGRDPHAPMIAGQPVTGRYQLFIGAGSHGCCLGDNGVQLQFYDYWLKGIDTGLALDTSTPMHLQMLGDPEGNYINASYYPMSDNYTSLRLDEGSLTDMPLGQGIDTIAWAPAEEGVTAYSYETEPYEDGAVIAGPMAATVYASSTNSNMQLGAAVYDVAPDGTATEISHGSLIGSLAALDADRSWKDANGAIIRPYALFDYDRYLTPGSVKRFDVHIAPTLYRVAPGHRLRLTLSTQWSADTCAGSAGVGPAPYGCVHTEPRLQTLPGGLYTIHRSALYPSSLNLPLLPPDRFEAVAAAPTPTSGSTVVPLDWGSPAAPSCNRKEKSQGLGGLNDCKM